MAPAEVDARARRASAEFRVAAFDAKGRRLTGAAGQVTATWEAKGIQGSLADGKLSIPADAKFQAGTVVAKGGELTAEARVRVFPPLPWTETFESSGKRGWWIGGGTRSTSATMPTAARSWSSRSRESGLQRSHMVLGPPLVADYTIQADIKGTQNGRKRSDVGLVASGYTLDLMGGHQRIQLRSWDSSCASKEGAVPLGGRQAGTR